MIHRLTCPKPTLRSRVAALASMQHQFATAIGGGANSPRLILAPGPQPSQSPPSHFRHHGAKEANQSIHRSNLQVSPNSKPPASPSSLKPRHPNLPPQNRTRSLRKPFPPPSLCCSPHIAIMLPATRSAASMALRGASNFPRRYERRIRHPINPPQSFDTQMS